MPARNGEYTVERLDDRVRITFPHLDETHPVVAKMDRPSVTLWNDTYLAINKTTEAFSVCRLSDEQLINWVKANIG